MFRTVFIGVILLLGLSLSSVRPMASVIEINDSNNNENINNPDPDCTKARVAIDMGSGTVEVRSAVVDICNQILLSPISVPPPLSIKFKLHLSSKPESDKNFSQDFMEEAARQISNLVNEVKIETKAKLLNDPALSQYSFLAQSDLEISGIATEAFRQSHNTASFYQILESKQIKMKTIDQAVEGHLGFIGALTVINWKYRRPENPNEIFVWDIGSGSMQIVGHHEGANPWFDFGNHLASVPARLYVIENFEHKAAFIDDGGKKKSVSPNPILHPGLPYQSWKENESALLSMVQTETHRHMEKLNEEGWLKKALSDKKNSYRVYGIGGVHNAVLNLVRNALPGASEAVGYTQSDLEILLDSVLTLSDEELSSKYHVEPQFTEGSATNVLLVLSVMRDQNIKFVEVLDVDNTYGTMVSPGFWPNSDSQSSSTKQIKETVQNFLNKFLNVDKKTEAIEP